MSALSEKAVELEFSLPTEAGVRAPVRPSAEAVQVARKELGYRKKTRTASPKVMKSLLSPIRDEPQCSGRQM